VTIYLGIGAILAALLGPVCAVSITLWWETRRRKREQKETLLQMLLATRGRYADPGYSWAIRTLPMHFHGNSRVLSAHKSYMDSVRLEPTPENADAVQKESSRREGLLLNELLRALGYGQLTADEIDQYTAKGLAHRELLLEQALKALPDIARATSSSAVSSHAVALKVVNADQVAALDAIVAPSPHSVD
jgi:hypothetical protein